MGFVVNPYDPCVANKIVNETQMTMTWHVDDLKISHINGWEITQVIKKFANIHRDIKVKRGKQHDYLGMDISYEKKGKVHTSMKHYIEKITESFPEEIGLSMAATPAADHLFQIKDKKEAK